MIPRRAIVVVGPHPGRAAALTRMLGLLGVDFAGAEAANAVVALGERVLAARERDDDVRALTDEAVTLLERHYAGRPLFGFMDSAASRLLPFWNEALGRIGVQPGVVIVVDSPSVRGAAGDAVPAWRNEIVWLDRLLEAEQHSRACPRVLVSYEDYLADWRVTAQRIAARLQVVWPVPAVAMSEAQERLLEAERRETAGATGAPARAPNLADAVYAESLEHAHRSGPAVEAFAGWRRDYDQARQMFLPALRGLDEAAVRVAELEAALARARSEASQARAEVEHANNRRMAAERQIEVLYGSRSWRITRPLRRLTWLAGAIRRLMRERGPR